MARNMMYGPNLPRSGNGMKGDYRYKEQQGWIDKVCESICCVPYRPDYHGKAGDGNTVLVYLPEDAAHNKEVDKELTHYGSKDEAKLYGCTDERYYYRPHFWSFENTDVNGFLSFDFANRGKLDLRGFDWQDVIESSIMLAYHLKNQSLYAAGCGGLFSLREADETYNDMNRSIAESFVKAHKRAFVGNIVISNDKKRQIAVESGHPLREYRCGDHLLNFGADFIVPCRDEKLEQLLIQWNRDFRPASVVDEIQERINRLEGVLFVWF